MVPIGKNVKVGSDDTIYAMKDGVVKFGSKRKTYFNGKTVVKKVINLK